MATIQDLIEESNKRSEKRKNAGNFTYNFHRPDAVKIKFLQEIENTYFKPRHIADEFNISKSEAGKFYKELERKGLAKQWGSGGTYYLTDKGKSIDPKEAIDENRD